MGVFFWDYQDYNDAERQWLCFILNGLVFCFTIIALYRSLQSHKKISLEVVPLGLNLVSTLVLLMLKLFEKGYQFDLIGYFIEIFTYFLFAFTFAVIVIKTKTGGDRKRKERCYLFCFVLVVAVLILMIMLTSLRVIERSCDSNLVLTSVITLGLELITYVAAVYNGKKILSFLSIKKQSSLTQTMLSSQIQTKNSLSDQFTIQRKRQIFIVLTIYTLSLFIRAGLLIVALSTQDSDFIKCQNLQGIFIITSEYFLGQIVLILIEINQLLPHVIIPLVVFIVPTKSKGEIENLSLKNYSDQDSDEQKTIDSRNQIIKTRVSSVFSDKLDSPRK